MFALTETVFQLRNSLPRTRQIDNPEVALVHATGGIMSSHTSLIVGVEEG